MPKISGLPPMNSPADDDVLPIDDDSVSDPTSPDKTKKISLSTLKTWLQSLVGWISTAMVADNAITAAKATTGDYSTTEAIVGYWTDGRPIYRKVVSLGSGPNSSNKSVASGVTDFDILVNLYGSVNGYRGLPVTFTSTVSGMTIIGAIRMIAGGDIVWTTSYNASSETGIAIVEYVKTP